MPRERISNRAALWKSRQQASQTLRNALLSSASTDESRSQFSRNHVSKERVAELWEIVRSKFLHKSPKLFDLLLSARSIPYAITIRQGFQFLFKLRLRFLVKCVAMHRLVPRHLTESGVIHPNQKKLNRVRSEETDSSSDDETKKGSDDNEGDDRHGERLGPALAPVTFVCACSSKTVRVWDVTRKVSVHPRLSQKIQADIQHIAFVSKFAFYACCGGDKTLHLFNARFEWMHDIVVPVHIQHLRYNETMNELLVIGTHDILMFSLDCIVAKGVPRVYLNLRRQSSTRLPLEEWITCIALDSNQHRLYAAVGSKILSFNLVTGDLTDKWANVSHRQVTSIVHFAAYDYTVLGCSNGRIKIINMTSLIVHEFASHTKKITALAVYPHGSFVLSASLDYTVRMFCLKTFQEVYCLNLKEQPISLEIIDGARLYIGSRDSVNVWSLNPINTSCSTTNTSVVNLAYSKSRKIPGRAIVQSEDGTTRIISPSTGKLITTLLPLLEVDRFRDTVHSSKIERLFLLTEAHEIWTVATDINPCVVIDIWAANQGDELQKLALFDGRLTDEEKKLKRNADIPDDFVLLLSGTKGGQIIVYDTVGNTAEYFQLHFGRITFMSVEAKRRLLVTAGEDNVVQLCQLHPLSREFIKIRVTITLKAIPRFASLIEDRICVASDDFSICNFKFDLDKRESKITVGHGRSDDHTDAILSLFSFPKVGIFVSSSKDNTIRVWDIYSTLLREVQFSEPIRGLCPAAKCGDLLIGLNNRIDTVKYGNYLPPSYVRMVQKMTWKPSIAEQPKKFDEAFNFLENHNVHRRVMDDNRLFSLAHPTLDIFGRSNFVKVAKLHTLKKAPSLAWGSKKAAEEDQRHEILQIRLRKLFEERQAKIAALKEQANEGLDSENDALHRAFEMFQETKLKAHLYGSFLTLPEGENARKRSIVNETDDFVPFNPLELVKADRFQKAALPDEIRVKAEEFCEDIPLVQPSTPSPAPSESELSDCVPLPSIHILETNATLESEEEEPAAELEEHPELLKRQITVEEIVEIVRKSGKLQVAPDGEIPNSILGRLVEEWKRQHTEFKVVGILADSFRKKKKVESAANDGNTLRSTGFKARLNKMLEQKEQEERDAAAAAAAAADAAAAELAAYYGEDESDEEDNELNVLMQTRRAMRNNMGSLVTGNLSKADPRYPVIVQKALAYEWFPIDEILHPRRPEESFRRLKKEVNSEAIVPLLAESFKVVKTAKHLTEVVEFTNWILEEYGIRDTTGISRLYCRFLENEVFSIADDEEKVKGQVTIIESLMRFGLGQLELVPMLLMLMISQSEALRSKVLKSLTVLGVKKPESPFLIRPLQEMFAQAEITQLRERRPAALQSVDEDARLPTEQSAPKPLKAALAQSPGSLEFRNSVMATLRRNLHLHLISSAKDPELVKKLKELNDSGLVDRNRKPGERSEFDEELGRCETEAPLSKGEGRQRSGRRISSVGGRRPSVAVGAASRKGSVAGPPIAVDKRRLSTVGPVAPKRQGSVRSSVTARVAENGDQQDQIGLPEKTQGSQDVLAELQNQEAGSGTRNAVTILQNPRVVDLIAAVNFLIQHAEDKVNREERERLEKIERESRAAEVARLERERETALADYMRQKEEERLLRIQQRKERITDLRKQRTQSQLPKITRPKTAGLFTGATHHSTCHHSREGLDFTIRRFPQLTEQPTNHRTTLAVHVSKMLKSMPVENIRLEPFREQQQQQHYHPPRPLRRQSAPPTRRSAYSFADPASEAEPSWHEFQVAAGWAASATAAAVAAAAGSGAAGPGARLRQVPTSGSAARRPGRPGTGSRSARRDDEAQEEAADGNAVFRTRRKYFVHTFTTQI